MPAESVRLIEPSVEWEAAYQACLEEFRAAGDEDYLRHYDEVRACFAGYVQRLRDHAVGRNLPEGWVPATTYWLASDDGRLLGEGSIRHRLTPALEDFGGHIGYALRPSARGQGYGTRLLALLLEKARALGLRRVLVTCDPENVASARVIEKNGGVLASRSLAHTGRMTSRYWIDL